MGYLRRPRRRAPGDRTISFLRQGFLWAPRLRRGSTAVRTRLLGRRATVIGGSPEAVALFYDSSRMRRARAVPRPVRMTLFGQGGVQVLDDAEHRHRKALFLQAMGPESLERLRGLAIAEWDREVASWRRGEQVVVFDRAADVTAHAVLTWAGLSVPRERVGTWARHLIARVDGFGSAGKRQFRARWGRRRTERWAERQIAAVRRGRHIPPAGSALQLAASWTELDGSLLDRHTAAVELLNFVRPAVAVAWPISYAAVMLRDHPEWSRRVTTDDTALDSFALEVRRIFPFTPVLGARARRSFRWEGQRFRRGQLVLLDVYGTTHDPVLWPDPHEFDPGRFGTVSTNPHTYIPHGGGDPATGHRCPGEGATMVLLTTAIRAIARVPHSMPEQDVQLKLTEMPTRPRSGTVIRVNG